MKCSKYHVELHYDVKINDLRIFRTDSFFITPTYEVKSEWEKDEQKKIMKYLSRFIRKPGSNRMICVEECVPGGYDSNGAERINYVKLKMFQVKNGAVLIRTWWEEQNQYFPGDAYGSDKAIQELMQTIEIY